MKKCTKCGIEKPEEAFQKRYDKASKSKLFSRCRDCEAERVKKWAQDNREILRRRFKAYADKHKAKYPAKAEARALYHNAVREGKIIRMPCLVCGSKKSDGHHPDYAFPFYVVWLCRRHHADLHHGKLFR